MKLKINNDADRKKAIEYLQGLDLEKDTFECDVEKCKKNRTLTQNASLHLWLEMVAQTLNDAGMDMRKVLKESIEIPWTKMSAKEQLWRPIQEAMQDIESTTKADTTQYNEVYSVLCREMAERHGVTLPAWPNRFEQ